MDSIFHIGWMLMVFIKRDISVFYGTIELQMVPLWFPRHQLQVSHACNHPCKDIYLIKFPRLAQKRSLAFIFPHANKPLSI
jgi:hypothetical protein